MPYKSILISRTPYGETKRIFVPNEHLKRTENFWQNGFMITTTYFFCEEQIILDRLSIWGGADKKDSEITSWEFPGELDTPAIYYILKKLFPKAVVELR